MVIKLTGTNCALKGLNAHLPTNQTRVFRQTIIYNVILSDLTSDVLLKFYHDQINIIN